MDAYHERMEQIQRRKQDAERQYTERAESLLIEQTDITDSEIEDVFASRPRSVSQGEGERVRPRTTRPHLRGTLRQRGALRQAMIVNEILGPPMALRTPNEP